MAIQELLEELIDASPIIAESISNYDAGKELVGDITINDLIVKSFSVLIDLIENNGIVFHVNHAELLEDFYNARFLIYLYKSFIPVFIRSRLNNDCDLYNKIVAELDGVSSNEYLVTLLRFFANSEGTSFSRDMLVFLEDKVTNTQEYSMAISVILNEISLNCDNRHSLSDSNDTTKFLSVLFNERIWVKGIISKLADKLKLNISRLEVLSFNFRLDMVDGDLAYIYSQIQSGINILEDKFFAKRIEKLRMSSVFYPEHYKCNHPPENEHLLMMVLAQISDKRIFNITPDYSIILSTFTEQSQFIHEAIKLASLEVI